MDRQVTQTLGYSDGMSQVTRGVAAAVFLAAAACSGHSPETAGSELAAFVGGAARVVWVQGDGSDPYALGAHLVLMGLDAADGVERTILATRASYVKPLLTPRGDRVVYSSHSAGKNPRAHIVNWDGTGERTLGDGFALATWENPADGREWLYLGTGNEAGRLDFPRVVRFPIDNPPAQELVWDQTPVSADTFQVSADGRHAGGLFPWPAAGIAQLPNKGWRQVGEGCWTAMSTVRGPLFWYFDGAHRNVTLVDARSDKRWTVALNVAPGFDNPEVYHPRWTNHPRFMTMSGPYNQGGANQVRSGGTQAEIWLGRFSEDFTRIEAWARVTSNGGGDAYPDVWIDRGQNPHPVRASGPLGPPVDAVTVAGPAAVARAVIRARLVHAGAIPPPESILPYRHALVVNEYEVLEVLEGTQGSGRIRVAQWVIRDSRVLPAAQQRRPGQEARLGVERFDAHPELEGERLLTDLPASDQPLFYDVSK